MSPSQIAASIIESPRMDIKGMALDSFTYPTVDGRCHEGQLIRLDVTDGDATAQVRQKTTGWIQCLELVE